MSAPRQAMEAVKLGLRRPDLSRPTVKLQLTGDVPAHPASADHIDGVSAWCLGRNNEFGTCGPVSVANDAILTWAALAHEQITVTDQAIFDLYRRSGNPQFDPVSGRGDGGVDMTVMLAALVRGGIEITHEDGSSEQITPLAFAEVATPTEDELRAVTAIFGGQLLAWDLDTAQQVQTGKGVWDYAPSRPWGGHATMGGAYTGAAGAHSTDLSLISWQRRIGTTPSLVTHQLQGAYVLVWRPLWDSPTFIAGVDRAALAAAFTAVTRRAFPIDVPPPAPAPVPAADAALAAFLGDEQLMTWARARHYAPSTRYAAAQIAKLAAAEGGST